MKLFRVVAIPFFLIPPTSAVQGDDTKKNIPVASVSQALEPAKNTEITKIEFTQEGLKALDAMETFVETYGPYHNHNSTRNQFVEGILRVDKPAAIREGVKKAGLFKPESVIIRAIKAYPNGSHRDQVQREAWDDIVPKIDKFLKEMGVAPKKANSVVDYTGKKYATERELEGFGDNVRKVKKEVEKSLPDGQRIAFKGGFNLDLTKSLRKGELPSDVAIINIKPKTNVVVEKK